MSLRPWLWLATRRSDIRIFQDQTVPEIVEQVLQKYGHSIDKR
jgi:type VI secretion system secreted protein VgrG